MRAATRPGSRARSRVPPAAPATAASAPAQCAPAPERGSTSNGPSRTQPQPSRSPPYVVGDGVTTVSARRATCSPRSGRARSRGRQGPPARPATSLPAQEHTLQTTTTPTLTTLTSTRGQPWASGMWNLSVEEGLEMGAWKHSRAVRTPPEDPARVRSCACPKSDKIPMLELVEGRSASAVRWSRLRGACGGAACLCRRSTRR